MRLTKKEIPYITSGSNIIEIPDIAEGHKYIGQAIDKLGQLEDIEEELGIDLITYFKIKEAKSVFVKELGNDISEMLVRNSKDNIDVCYKGFVNIPECDSSLYFKDYGKTWALTKEELL